MKKNAPGQSTIEYIVLVSAVLAVLIIFLGPGGLMHQRVGETLNMAVNSIGNMVNGINLTGH